MLDMNYDVCITVEITMNCNLADWMTLVAMELIALCDGLMVLDIL